MSDMPDEREIRKTAYAEGRNIGLGVGGVAGVSFGYYWGQHSFLWAAALFIGFALLFAIIGGGIWWIGRWIDKASERQKERATFLLKWLFLYPFFAFIAYLMLVPYLHH